MIGGFSIAFEIGIIAYNTAYGTRVALVFVSFILALLAGYVKISNKARRQQARATAPIYAMISETCAGMEHIRAYAWQDALRNQFKGQLSDAELCHYDLVCLQNQLILIVDGALVAFASAIALFAFAAGYQTSANGVAFAFVSLLTLRDQTLHFVRFKVENETPHASVGRILEFIQTTPTEPGPAPRSVALDPLWPASGKVEFYEMSLRFE